MGFPGHRLLPLAILAIVSVSCNETGTGPDSDPEFTTLSVDASQDWAFLSLEGEEVRAVADPSTSTAWDIGFHATSVMLNGGAAGPGSVQGHCVCQNGDATDAAIMAMTADGELEDFAIVGLTTVPAHEDAWRAAALDPVIADWYQYDPQTHVVSAAPNAVYLLALREGAYAVFHVIEIANATQQHAGTVTVEFAVQPAAEDPLGEPDTLVADVSAGRVYLDLAAAVLGSGTSWDLALEGYTVLTNGGVSGDGGVGAVATTEAFETITSASGAPAQVYAGDVFGGVFAEHPWYRYNLDGHHTIFPTFDVYLVRRGLDVWKVQVLSYYNEAGESRHITVRLALLGS